MFLCHSTCLSIPVEDVVEAVSSVAEVYTISEMKDFGETCFLVVCVCSNLYFTSWRIQDYSISMIQ